MARAVFIAWTVSVGIWGQVSAADLLALSVQPGWDGVTRAGATTEVGVSVRSQLAMRVTVRVLTVAGTTATETDIAPDQVSTVWLPHVAVPGRPTVQIQVLRDDQVIASKQHWLAPPAQQPNVVAAAGLPASFAELNNNTLPGTAVHRLSTASLPRTPQAYDTVSALVLAAAALATMDARQQRALEHHLAGCGRVVTVGFPPQLKAGFQRRAGCESRLLSAVDDVTDLARALARVLDRQPQPLPASSEMNKPAGVQSAITLSVMTFIFGYLLLSGVAAQLTQRTWPLLVLPLVASVFAMLMWRTGSPRGELTLWSELQSGAPVARYTGQLDFRGTGRSLTQIPLPPATALAGLPDGATFRVFDAAGVPPRAVLEMATHLGSRHTAVLTGTRAVTETLSVDHTGGQLVVAQGPKTLSAASAITVSSWLAILPPPHQGGMP